MTILFFVYFLVLVLSVRGIKSRNNDYLSIEYTNTVKRFFLFFVFVRHFLQYQQSFGNSWTDTIGLRLDAKGGQLLVTMFLFYSGYGLMESARKKGKDYIKQLPGKRIWQTLMNFDMAVLVYMVVTVVFLDYEVTIKRVLLSLVGWDNFGNSNWYIFCILAMYVLSYVSLKSFGVNNKAVLSILAGTLLFTMVLGLYKEGYWYNTAFCYCFGCFYSVNREKLEAWLDGKELLTVLYLFLIFMFSYHNKGVKGWYYIHTLAFTGMILLLTQRVPLKNRFFSWMGKNLFPLYIFQRLPMLLLKDTASMQANPYVFFGVAACITLMIAVVYHFLMTLGDRFNRRIRRTAE